MAERTPCRCGMIVVLLLLPAFLVVAADSISAAADDDATLERTTKQYGADHWRTVDAQLALDEARFLGMLSPEQRSRLKQAAALHDQALSHADKEEFARAVPLYLESLKLEGEVRGGMKHRDCASSLNNLAESYRGMGDYARAAVRYHEALQIRSEVLGKRHPAYAQSLNNLAAFYDLVDDYARAVPLAVEARAVNKAAYGEKHLEYAASVNTLASLYKSMGDPERAEPLYVEASAVLKEVVGEKHPFYATSLNNLGELYRAMADYPRAERFHFAALALRNEVVGKQHSDYAMSLNNLAGLFKDTGAFARAEPLYIEALEISKRVFGTNHPDYAQSLNNLAVLYFLMADYSRAEAIYLESLAIKKALGRNLAYATGLSNLAQLYHRTDDHRRAEAYYLEALKIEQAILGGKHPRYSISLNNLAGLYASMHDTARAVSLYRKTIEIRAATVGKKHPLYAAVLNNLGGLYLDAQDYKQAERLCLEAFAIRKEVHGTQHPEFAQALSNLAVVYAERGDFELSEPPARAALAISRASLETTALVQSERQQLAMGQSLRHQLDHYVSLGVASGKYSRNIFAQVLAWKGATLVRQRGMRLAADAPAARELFMQLQRTAALLATLSRAVPGREEQRPAWREKLADLTQAKERLEAELSAASAPFRRATKPITLDDLSAALPNDAVLVDYLEFEGNASPKAGVKNVRERRLVAFVVRSAAEEGDRVRMVSLGPVAPIDAAIDTWRTTFGMNLAGVAAGKALREAVWQPLIEHIGDARTILVSTDGALGRLPLGTLPGKQPGTYLLEDHRLVFVPVPQLLPTLIDPAEKQAREKELLLLGDVDYDAAPSGLAAVANKRRPPLVGESASPTDTKLFEPLGGAAAEIAAIKKLYGRFSKVRGGDDPRSLVRAQADEARFRTLAPQYKHLHLATHGFFAGERFVSALGSRSAAQQRDGAMFADRELVATGYNPGLLSGLALTGANLEPSTSGEDGILTAQEIGVMDLSGVDTVVLSACDTGLGETAGGEGLLGVQRAFQVAGARTTVAGFWKVDDLVTRYLMERFYTNLWEKKMSRLDALREAQLYVLNHPDKIDGANAVRGAERVADPAQIQPQARTSPKYWAAFTLSGDWR